MPRRFAFTIVAFLLFASAVPLRAQTAGMLSFQGLIKDNNGQPVNGSVTLQFRIFDDQFAGNLVDMDGDGTVENVLGQDAKQVAVTATNGIVSAPFGPVSAKSFDGTVRYLEVTVNGSPLSRQFMSTAPATAEQMNRPFTGTGQVFVASDGKVGVGTPNPIGSLDVRPVAAGTDSIVVSRSTGEAAAKIRLEGDGRGVLSLYQSGVESLRLDSGDNSFFSKPVRGQFNIVNTSSPPSTPETAPFVITKGPSDPNPHLRVHIEGDNRPRLSLFQNGEEKISLDAGQLSFFSNPVQVPILQVTGGSDLAEPFDVGSSDDSCEPVDPGMVVVIDSERPGRLKLASEPYDRRVAGVISGAKGLNPGMVMRSAGDAHTDGDHPVALTGRVWCWCDASNGAISAGDRLTTSSTLGHAMKAVDSERAAGAVIGKAMSSLEAGRGLVLVLVQPQ